METIKFIDGTESVLVVRCKECVEYDDDWCMYWQNVINPDDFCSYGEREDECAKEYEELGLKELKELIEADRKTEPITQTKNLQLKFDF